MTVTVLGGALTLLTTCSSKDDTKNADDTPRPTTTRPSTTTLTPEETKKQQVITAREAADDAELGALGPPSANPDHPALAETHTGLMLERLQVSAESLQMTGVVSRLPEDSRHSVNVESVRFEVVDGQEVAFLAVCGVEDAERVNATSGAVLRSGVRTFRSSEAMKMVDGVWKLAERRQDDMQEGVATCEVE